MTTFTVYDVRWQCPRGHFVAEDDIREQDIRDPGSYYGVSTITEYTCKGCSRPEDPYMYFDRPRLVEVGSREVQP